MPEDIFGGLWAKVRELIEDDLFCCTTEIFEEYEHIEGAVGKCLCNHKSSILFEIGDDDWEWDKYVLHVNRMRDTYKQFISEYNSNRKNTVGINDLSIVALAKTLKLPVVSMEGLDRGQISASRMRIPRLCDLENVVHLTFNELLRQEGINI